jgi:hypothetical protein
MFKNTEKFEKTVSLIFNKTGGFMETRIDFLSWLSTKLYLINVGMYATIGLIMVLPKLFVSNLGMQPLVASFIAFFIVSFLRAAYESVIIYETTIKNLSIYKMLILTFCTASAMSLISFFLKPKIGYFAIPVAISIAAMIVGRLKAVLWPSTEHPGFFSELPAKLELNKQVMYRFYAILVGISYLAVAKYNFDFNYSFAAAFFIGMMFEEVYNVRYLYDRELSDKVLVSMTAWAAICAITASALIWVMVGFMHLSGKPATIISVVLLKLIQPLGSRKFILGL